MKSNRSTGEQIVRHKKTPKGTVKVEVDKGWLRVRFTHAGKRYAFAIGLPDSEINRKVAEQKARQIELDILSGNFDPSLQKYRPQKREQTNINLMSAGELLQQFQHYLQKENRRSPPCQKYWDRKSDFFRFWC